MPLKGILAAEVKRFVSDNPSLEGQDESEQFQMYSLFHLLKEYFVEWEDIVGGIVDDGDDFGIDAIYSFVDGKIMNSIDDLEDNFSDKSRVIIRIVQTKKGSGFSEATLAKLKEGLEMIFDVSSETLKGNPKFNERAEIVRKLWEKFHTNKNDDVKIYIDYVCSGDTKNANDKVQDKKRNTEIFLRKMGLKSAKVNLIGSGELHSLSISQGTYSKVLVAEGSIVHNEESASEDDITDSMGTGEYILIVDGHKFFEFITDGQREIENRIFEANVRDYQGERKEVINNIKNTISSDKRSNFWRMNNGVTILASNISNRGNTKFRLENYQIINGCQTAFSIYETLSSGETGKFELVVKLIITKGAEIDLEVIQATNSQIPIEPIVFKAQSEIHIAIERYLQDGINKIYYERRSNFYRRRGIAASKIIGPKKLFQIIRSIYFQKPCTSKRSPTEFFREEADSIFNPNYEFLYYRIACILFLKTVTLSSEYKKRHNLTEHGISVINNGVLPIARILFSLLVESGDKVDMTDKNSELIKKSDEYIDQINGLGVEGNGLFDKAFGVLTSSVQNYIGQKGGDKTVTNILRTQDLEDKYIPERVRAIL